MGQDAWAPFSTATKKQLVQTPSFFLLSEGSDKGTPLLLGEDNTPLELGEQYE